MFGTATLHLDFTADAAVFSARIMAGGVEHLTMPVAALVKSLPAGVTPGTFTMLVNAPSPQYEGGDWHVTGAGEDAAWAVARIEAKATVRLTGSFGGADFSTVAAFQRTGMSRCI